MPESTGETRYVEELEAWRARRRDRVAGPDGWLTVVGLEWLADGSTTIGSDESAQIRLPAGPGLFGTIRVQGDEIRLTERGGRERTLLDDAGGERTPDVVRLGSVSFYVIRREGRAAIRVKDEASPARTAFAGLSSFPVSQAWLVEARFEPSEPGRSVRLATVLDLVETYAVPGSLAFEIGGDTHRLDTYDEPGEEDLFVIFGDRTNTDETYGGGRYLYVKRPGPDGRSEIDFNRAYNPPCMFTVHATCALAAPENRVPVRIDAGEIRYQGPAAT